MVDVLEELELDRVAEPIGRLESVEDDAAATPGEVLVEEADGASEGPGQVRFPFVPLVGLDVAARDPTPAAIDGVEVVADRPAEVPGVVEVWGHRQRVLVQVPIEQPRRVLGVILRIAATVRSQMTPRRPSPARPACAQRRPTCVLPIARRPGHHGERGQAGAEGCYLYSRDPVDAAGAVAYARFFNPTVGIAEDPATGTAAGPLAARLVAEGRIPDESTVIIEQGYALGRPSRIAVSVSRQRVRVGGSGLVVAEGALIG